MSDLDPAMDGQSYVFDASASFSKSPDHCPSGSFLIENKMPFASHPYLIFGLTQGATINGGTVAPTFLNAASVLSQQQVQFTPVTTVYVYLAASYTSGSVITKITSTPAVVQFVGNDPLSLKYDDQHGTFVLIPASNSKHLITHPQPKGIYRFEK
jgi:hypothetical protein